MPEASRLVLPKKKPNFTGLFFGIALGVCAVLLIGSIIWDSWVFNHMTTAQHLWEAGKASRSPDDIALALRHVRAIPANSVEASEAQVLGAVLREQEATMKAAQT